MADVTLNAAMRSNLLSLQQTTKLQATTQGRLATGKKVNSALDNPASYFAAQALNNRASDLSGLLDGMGQAIQTITAATQGITAAESVVSQMNSVANSAVTSLGSAASAASGSKEAMSVASGGTTGSVAANNATQDFRQMVDKNDNSLGIAYGDTVTVKVDTGSTYTFTVGASSVNNTANQSNGGGNTMSDLAIWLSNVDGSASGLTLTAAAGIVKVASKDVTHTLTLGGSLLTELQITGGKLYGTKSTATTMALTGTASVGTGGYTISALAGTSTLLRDITASTGAVLGSGTGSGNTGNYVTASSTLIINSTTLSLTSSMTVQDLLSKINSVSGMTAVYSPTAGILISNQSGSGITISGTAAGLVGGVQTYANLASNTASAVKLYLGIRAGGTTGLSALATYTQQFDTLRSQLDQLVQDASYQGVNLIAGGAANPLTVQFNNDASNPNKLVINAVDLTSTGLNVGAAASNWSDTSSIQSTIGTLTNAQTTLRTQASTFGQNLTTVQTRQDFTTNLINTLQTGAGNLVNADMNTESANMLALQTQNQLGISSLSLASQAAQSILKLFP